MHLMFINYKLGEVAQACSPSTQKGETRIAVSSGPG